MTRQIEENLEPIRSVGLLDLVIVLLRRKWVFVIGMVLVSALAITYSILATPYYKAVAVILPSQGNMSSPLSSLMGDLPISGLLKSFDFLGNTQDNTKFMSILDGRILAEKVVNRFDLETRYEFRKRKKYFKEDVLKTFRKNMTVEEDDYNNIRISVTDSNPEVAAEMANYVVDVLDTLTYKINRDEARGSRIFFESRIQQIKRDLDSVHQAFAKFQIKNNFIDLEAQVKASIEAIAGLEAESMSADLEKTMLQSAFGNNAKITEAGRRKKAIQSRMEDYMQNGSGTLMVPLKKTPELGIQYAYLYRDVKIQETIYGFMLQMFEQARLKEINNAPTVTILEPAIPPQKKVRPKRAILCLTAFFVGLILISIYVLLESWVNAQKAEGTEAFRKLGVIRDLLKKWR